MAYLEQNIAAVLDRLSRIEAKINRVLGMALGDARRDIAMAKGLERIQTEIGELDDPINSAVELLNNLSEQIRDSAGDEEKANQLADDIDAKAQKLAEAVVKNTPHDPSANA